MHNTVNVEIVSEEAARLKLKNGIDAVSNAVKTTLGPRGKNVIIYNDYGSPIITKDGVTVAKSINLADPYEDLGAQLCKQVSLRTNEVAGDGPQPLYSNILAPNGWVQMGSLKVGDIICGTNGTFQEVEGIYPQGEKEIYQVHLKGDRIVECCEDHLWTIITAWGRVKTLSTKLLMAEVEAHEDRSRTRFFTPRHWVNFSTHNQTLHPYLIGLLIGDGSLSGTGSIELSLAADQEYIIASLPLPEGITAYSVYDEDRHYHRVKLKGTTPDGKTMHKLVEEVGLLGTKSATKFIPKQYLYAGVEEREELLRGLADTDGYVNNRGRLEYSTISYELAQNVTELLRGLGKTASCYEYARKPNSSYSETTIYRVTELKGDKYGNGVLGITPTGKFTEMQCISVSNPDNLYVTDGYAFTHNTTTATVLAQAIVNEGLKYVTAGGSPLALKRGLDKALDTALRLIDDVAKEVTDRKEIEFIASISGNDQEIGSIVADAIVAVGVDGIITLEESAARETSFRMLDGFSFSEGYASPFFINDLSKNTTVYEQVNILMIDGRFDSFEAFLPVLQIAAKSAKPLLIIAETYSDVALRTLINNKTQSKFPWVAIKTPGFGDQKKEHIRDIRCAVGGVVFSEAEGHKHEDIKDSFFGYVRKLVITKNSTTLIEGRCDQGATDDRIALLKNMLDTEESDYNREKISERIGKLQGGVAVIKIGASTDTEAKEKKYRYEDALNATRAAIEEGTVPGGGSCLLRISQDLASMTEVDPDDENEKIGVKILVDAMKEPFMQICRNGGFKADVYSDRVLTAESPWGFNAKTGTVCNLAEAGIIDPAKVTKTALTNAVSIASLVLTTDVLIAPVIDKSEKVIIAESSY